MAFLRIDEARSVAKTAASRFQKTARAILNEESQRISKHYDIFLSHSYQDAEIILGVKKIIESLGLTVYVDWLDDTALDRGNVTAKTAAILRSRMRDSSSLVYAHSQNATDSAWMPWELGYFDGFRPGFVWILPLVSQYDAEFDGSEYLGLYPALEKLSSLAGALDLGFPNVTNLGRMKLHDAITRGATFS